MNTMGLEQSENRDILVEIRELKSRLNELYRQNGPASSDYISLSLKLNYLMKEFFEVNL
ncbi:hypothetical protein [Neobacillus vireti]|uniref:hypothetical protein n=1 Tax=Neobacillus vireti TaxID=220686 RepID=UPI0012E26818|nr:hypothetical protein [Neobacillus vireti]